MTTLLALITLLFGVNTVCPIGSQERVTPIGPDNDWSHMECGYADNAFNVVCIESYDPTEITWQAVHPAVYITAAVLTYENGDTETHAIDPYAALNVPYTSGSGQNIDTVAWCGTMTLSTDFVFVPFFGR